MGGYGLTYTDISDNILYSGKSYSISNGDLFDICNDTVTTVLETILDYLNDFETDAPCLVKISSTDGVCGYLASKLTSIDGSVNIITNTNGTPADETLDLSVNPRIDIINSESSITTDVVISSTGNIYTEGVPDNLILNTGKLVNNGDTVEVECLVINSAVNNNNIITVSLGGNTLSTFTFNNNSTKGVKYFFIFSRVNATTISVRGRVSLLDSLFYSESLSLQIIANNITVSDLDTTTNNFNVAGTIISGTLTGKQLLMTILKK
jgi:hypothetical protein